MSTLTPHNIDAAVGRLIREHRVQIGMTQTELAATLRSAADWDVDPTGLSRIESGRRSLRLRDIERIAYALAVPLGNLIPVRAGDQYQAGVAQGLRIAADRIAELRGEVA